MKFGLDDDEFVVSNFVRMYVMCGVMDDVYLLFCKRIEEYVDFIVNCNFRENGFIGNGDFSKKR